MKNKVSHRAQHAKPKPVALTREGVCLETNASSTEPTGGSTRGGISLHVVSEGVSAFSARFAKGEEQKIDDESTASCSNVPGDDGRDMLGWELVALRRREDGLESGRRNAGAEGSVSGAGSDSDRRNERAVIGVSNRVTTVGMWLLSNSSTAAWRSGPFLPSTSS